MRPGVGWGNVPGVTLEIKKTAKKHISNETVKLWAIGKGGYDINLISERDAAGRRVLTRAFTCAMVVVKSSCPRSDQKNPWPWVCGCT